MAQDYAGAVRAGAMAASRLHRDLGLRDASDGAGGAIDVFAAIYQLDLPLMLRPLKGLMGAFLNDPCPGILIGTGWRMNIQRFTAAHELGHCILKHRPSLDDEDQILRRVPLSVDARNDYQETEADAFAVGFMLPKWLIVGHCARQGWRTVDLLRPEVVYQLPLRVGDGTRLVLRHGDIMLDAVMPGAGGEAKRGDRCRVSVARCVVFGAGPGAISVERARDLVWFGA